MFHKSLLKKNNISSICCGHTYVVLFIDPTTNSFVFPFLLIMARGLCSLGVMHTHIKNALYIIIEHKRAFNDDQLSISKWTKLSSICQIMTNRVVLNFSGFQHFRFALDIY